MTGARVLVAGATGALGRTIARDLADRGHRVALHAHRRVEAARDLAAALPGSGHIVVSADLVDPHQSNAAVADAVAGLGGLDHVVNAAWPAVPAVRVADLDTDAVDAGLRGYRAHAQLCRAVVPSLRRSRGSVVLLGGALSSRLHPGLGQFGAGKAAATLLTHVLALEEGDSGVRANVVSLGRIAVDPADDLGETDPDFAALDRIGALRRVLPLPTPKDVAATVAWLISDDASALTGQTITLAGGERI